MALIGNKRPELLFLCQTLPYPPDGGVNIRSYHLMRLLASEYRVTAICFYRRTLRPQPSDIEASLEGLRELGEAEAFAIPQEGSRLRWYWDHARSVVRRLPYTRYAYATRAVEARISEILQSRPIDLIHIDSLDLAHYLPMVLGDVPVVCGHHNVESVLLRLRADMQSSKLAGMYMRLQAGFVEEEERSSCRRVALNITCSSVDAGRLEAIAPGASVLAVPNGVDTQAFLPDYSGSEGLVFVGGHTWFPNRDGMEWFAESVLPMVRRHHPDVPVTWIGRMPDEVGRRIHADHGITVTGYVEDIRPFVRRAACMIVPIRVGGGTRLKILDGWSMGKALVSTSVGCEGLEARDDENILIADNATSFADAALRLLSDPLLRGRLGQAARATAERTYDWNVIQGGLLEAYRGETARGRGKHA